MVQFLSILAIGFFLGMRHATDPDHVIAVTTIVTRQKKPGRAAAIGALWGIGHTLTIFVVGAVIIVFGLSIPPRLGLTMELGVGIMLIVLGAINISSFFRDMTGAVAITSEQAVVHSHAHSHGDYVHRHAHAHSPEVHAHKPEQTPLASADRMLGKLRGYQQVRPLVVGIVHGLAGSAAVALLVLTTIRDPRWALAYLLLFGLGTVGGMTLITMSMASALHLFRHRGNGFSRNLGVASGLVSLAFGLIVAYQICISHGLFTAHPLWTPR